METAAQGEDRFGDRRVPRPDARLVKLALDGDPAAGKALFRLLQPIVLGYCRKRLRDLAVTEAEDCAQDVMVAVLTALPDYRYGHEKFLSWVFGIAAHKVVDRLRDRRRSREQLVPSTEPGPAGRARLAPAAGEEFARLEQDRQVGRLLRRLPEPHRKVLVLRLAFGYSAEETARLLQMPSAGAVRVAQHRALRLVRKLTGRGS
ncbi:sigma-70 family RNA polymerase sigma factor [Amycolatopsis mongoliensis]|uniref:Sigma-70 family RNA polymerase sigma factor n=1 Tax=Amycolatopsis mongoliensis TaxID=715475 RepID=A0A9Y2NE54_9PSEU|nr:sigma-70 family RNA polymerase sigma factor [Amycolatopsis sp. 4-36]WIX98333.1 sigma-70 family RNA polymerase sigma factor [Amycolatopsis sp. 4-36]